MVPYVQSMIGREACKVTVRDRVGRFSLLTLQVEGSMLMERETDGGAGSEITAEIPGSSCFSGCGRCSDILSAESTPDGVFSHLMKKDWMILTCESYI
jgi:hypothetical protein